MHGTMLLESTNEMANLFNDEQQLLQTLEQCLMQEKEQLENNADAERLFPLNEQKTQLYLELQQCHSKQSMLLEHYNLSRDAAGLLAFFSQLPASLHDNYLQQWRQIEEQLQRCQAQNLVNGCLIFAGYQHTQRIFQLLYNCQDPVSIYDENGVTQTTKGKKLHTSV